MAARVLMSGRWYELDDAFALLNRTYKRDRRGRFGSGGGGYVQGKDITGEIDYASTLAAQKAGGATRNEDVGMAIIQRQQGFNGPPHVVSREEFDRAVAAGEVQETFRGVTGEQASHYAEQYRTGDLYAATGLFGSGTYVSTSRAGAEHYEHNAGAGDAGTTLRIGLRADANVVTWADLGRQMKAFAAKNSDAQGRIDDLRRQMLDEASNTHDDDAAGRVAIYKRYGDQMDAVGAKIQLMSDPGVFAAAHGYDAISTGHPSNVSVKTDDEQLVILNRTATIVEAA